MATEKFNWRKDCVGTLIDGIGSCEMIDSSGELVMLDGIDVSSVKSDMVFNYEHTSKEPSQTVGKIYEVKKIFKEEDCENDRHLLYWNKVKVPFLYVAGELLDATNHRGAQEVRAMLQYDDMYAGKHNYQNLVNFSVEGSRLKQKDGIVHKCIMRKMTITHQPCLKVCEANILQAEKKNEDNSIASISEFIGLIMDKSESIQKGLSGADRKYWQSLGEAKGAKTRPNPNKSYRKITTATPLPSKKNRPAVPKEKYIKRVHTSTSDIKSLKAGDSIQYKKPTSRSGYQIYNDPDTFKNPPAKDNGSDSKPEDDANKTEKVIIDLKKKPIKKALVAGMGVGAPSSKVGSNAINKSQRYWEVFSKQEQLIDLLEKKLPDTDPRIRMALAKTVAYKTLKDREIKLEKLIEEALDGK